MKGTPSQITFKMLDGRIEYDGKQIRPLWAFEELGIKGDSIICFFGPMQVKSTEMIDLQDIRREGKLAEILISSDESLNFIIEHFDCQPSNLLIAYHRLRLLVFIAMEVIREKFQGGAWRRDGTDIYLADKKISVGIATISNISMKIHFAINLADSGFPEHVNATGLASLGSLERKRIVNLAEEIGNVYSNCIEGCWYDITKSRTFST
ncbi:MAG: DUF366 family protein [Candidatus Hodarchaeota archaeon]